MLVATVTGVLSVGTGTLGARTGAVGKTVGQKGSGVLGVGVGGGAGALRFFNRSCDDEETKIDERA